MDNVYGHNKGYSPIISEGDGKQQFTVEIRPLVDSICDKVASVLPLSC